MDVNALPMTSKTCSKCKQLKQKSEFSRDKYSSNGYKASCKDCCNLYQRQNAGKHAAQKAIYQKAYNERNNEVLAIKSKRRSQEKYQQDRGTIYHVLRELLWGAKTRAKKNNLPFDLTIEWLQSMIISHCPITLQPIDWLKEQVVNRTAGPNSPSIDKNKPELGYIQSNCSIVSYRGNAIKSNGTIDEHRRVVQYMAAQQLRDIEF